MHKCNAILNKDMQEIKTQYLIKILPNGSQYLCANTGIIETLEKDSNVFELFYTEDSVNNCDDNNNHLIDDYCNSQNKMAYSNTLYLRHCPVSYENDLDKLCNMIHVTAH